MLKYRCYFLNRVGASIAVKTIQSDSDDGARLSALGMLRLLRRAETLELWQGSELCHRLGRDALDAL